MQGTAKAIEPQEATIRSGMARLGSRMSDMEGNLSLILDRLVKRPKNIETNAKTPEPQRELTVSECMTEAHLTAVAIEQSITAIQNLIG